MKPVLGWTMLSREEMRQVERSLANSEQDTRDEIGFLLIHQGFADRFFPGTSVLHTRVRYALFVPWLYLQAAAGKGRGSDLNRIPSHPPGFRGPLFSRNLGASHPRPLCALRAMALPSGGCRQGAWKRPRSDSFSSTRVSRTAFFPEPRCFTPASVMRSSCHGFTFRRLPARGVEAT